MASDARTIWRAKPCGWRDRERVVALGEEFGPAGPLVLDVLEELAKEQRADGSVRTGLRSLARAAFLPRGSDGLELAQKILAFGAKVGAFDDLAIAGDDEMTVTCRVSGFETDQGRGSAAVRQARRRSGTDRDAVTPEVTTAPVVTSCHLTGEERKGKEERTSSSSSAAVAADAPRAEVDHLCQLLAELVVANDSKARPDPAQKRWRDAARLLLDRDGRSVEEIERVIRWALADDFWRSNVLSMPKLRERFGQLLLQMQRSGPRRLPTPSAESQRRADALRRMTGAAA